MIKQTTRRQFLQAVTALSLTPLISYRLGLAAPVSASTQLSKPIPATGEQLPVIGMGSWMTFDIGRNKRKRAQRVEVLRTFFDLGGGMIDSSPMYGTSEQVIGQCLEQLDEQDGLFSATKVWTPGQALGIQQMQNSQALWKLPQFDLMQIHNLVDWQTHLETLRQWKAEQRVRYIGITTSHGRRHQEFAQAMRTGEFDFVQFTYNVIDREAEQRLLPLAQELGIAVIINRPFQRGGLFNLVKNKPLPGFAAEIDCANWAQFFLKFIVSHPAVTCAIPATSQVAHMQENMGAAYGRMPDIAMRQRMASLFV